MYKLCSACSKATFIVIHKVVSKTRKNKFRTDTTRKVFISDDLLVTLQTLVTEWYVFHDKMSIFVVSCM
jgi:hypothetical protein